MKPFWIIIIVFFQYSCSLNDKSDYWNKDPKKTEQNKKIINTIETSNKKIFDMNYNEFKVFLDDYVKKNDYPEID
jgi:hypothetical protein